jgi:hypothetical protein
MGNQGRTITRVSGNGILWRVLRLKFPLHMILKPCPYDPLKRRSTSRLHGAISQKTVNSYSLPRKPELSQVGYSSDNWQCRSQYNILIEIWTKYFLYTNFSGLLLQKTLERCRGITVSESQPQTPGLSASNICVTNHPLFEFCVLVTFTIKYKIIFPHLQIFSHIFKGIQTHKWRL